MLDRVVRSVTPGSRRAKLYVDKTEKKESENQNAVCIGVLQEGETGTASAGAISSSMMG